MSGCHREAAWHWSSEVWHLPLPLNVKDKYNENEKEIIKNNSHQAESNISKIDV